MKSIDPNWKWTGYTFTKGESAKYMKWVADSITFDDVRWDYAVKDRKLYTRPTPTKNNW